MQAKALIEKVIKKQYQENAYVMALIPEHDSSWHVHWDEEVPPDRPISVRVKLNTGNLYFADKDGIKKVAV